MKVLFVTTLFFSCPPKDGSSIRTFNLIKHLSKNNDMVLICIKEKGKPKDDLSELKRYCSQIIILDFEKPKKIMNYLFNVFSFKPFFVWRKHDKRIQKIVDKTVKENQFDLIHVDGLAGAQFALAYCDMPKIIDARDAIWLSHNRQMRNKTNVLLKMYYWLKLFRLKKYELKIYAKFDRVVFISKVDEQTIFSLSNGKLDNLATIPFGIDIPEIKSNKHSTKPLSLVFTGNMPYFPNIDAMLYFCKDIFPIVKKEFPDLRLYIVGKNPGPEILKLSEPNDIMVTGEVEDIRVWLEKAAIFVCPLRYGSGMKIKILEAMAMAKPIVSTSVGVEGIKIKNGENIIIADNSTSFASKTIELLRNENLRNHIGENGRKLVEKEYRWEKASSEFNNLYSEVIDAYRKRNISKVRFKEKPQESLTGVSN